ncbi:MFS transporter [Fodinicola feengrottensis]|uniref:MFS transporter n=1 Tax=Fodinicola feengrottensis TaxID=435914 RepID=UPI002442A825|nr:MFS transporter [Fodinicola feengrottensis]
MRPRLVLALACAGSFMVILDATIVSVALPQIRATLGFSAISLPWVVNAYTLVFAGFLLLGGRCADVFGPRRLMVVGTGLFTVARVAAGLATAPGALLAARARCRGSVARCSSRSRFRCSPRPSPTGRRGPGRWAPGARSGRSPPRPDR